MKDPNPAWVVLVCGDEDVTATCLSGGLIRKNSTDSLVAFVKDESINVESKKKLQDAFDLVIFAPDAPEMLITNVGKSCDILLLQSLNLATFSSIVVLQPGILVFRSLYDILEESDKVIRNKAGDWKIICGLTPSRIKYSQVSQKRKNGHSFDIVEFFKTEIFADSREFSKSCEKEEEMVVPWNDLKIFTGEKLPFVEIPSDFKVKIENFQPEPEGFWQKVVMRELASTKNTLYHDIPILPIEEKEKSWIAVVGMACRFPEANSIEEYWQLLLEGRNTVSSPPSSRLGKHTLSPEVRANFLKCPIDDFDAGFFGIPPSEVAITDPQARLLLETSWEAFEDAAINPEKLRNSQVGVFYGSWMQEYRDMLHDTGNGFLRKYIGNGFGCSSAKLSFFYGFTGPNIATESGCSSSMVAVEMACESLQKGKCPIAIAAGTNIILQMDPKAKVVWAEDGVCKTFDSKANGYGRGEGVAVLVLKRYSDALRDGDRIHGIIRGTASSQEGLSKSFGTPTVESEAKAMENAMKAAGVLSKDVDYVEAHATGTGVGDPIEAEAIVKAYSSSQRISPLLIGSVKTNIGHTEACSGIAAIIKVLLAMKNEVIPKHINVENINPKIDFTPIPGKIALESHDWKRSSIKPRIAGVSNFGITGTDVHLIIQEPPKEFENPNTSSLKDATNIPFQILTLSAKSKEALQQLCKNLAMFLENNKEDNLVDIVYTLNARRAHHSFRTTVLGTTKKEFLDQLRNQNFTDVENLEKTQKVGFICHDLISGEDLEQYVLLYSTFPTFQLHMNACDTICKEVTGFSPVSYLLKNEMVSKLSTIDHQFCAFSVSYSLFKLWESWGVKASYIVGLNNLGELIGAVVTCQVTLENGFKAIINGNFTLLGNDKNDPSPKITFISCKDKGRLNSKLSSILESGCDAFIEVDLHGKIYDLVTADNLQSLLLIPQKSIEKGNAKLLTPLFTALAALYKSGFPINWEGFYAHLHNTFRKMSLPHYPFQRKSIWFASEEKVPIQESIQTPSQHWKQVHPLLGNYLQTDEEPELSHTFQNVLVTQSHTPYLCDHVIGTEMIFPAAGFLELLLAANHFQGRTKATDQGGNQAHVLENFQVHFPLHLDASSGKNLKTVMKKNINGTEKWNIFVEGKENPGDESFKRYASGEVAIQKEGTAMIQHNVNEIKDQLVLDEECQLKLYSKFAAFGLKFGKEFQSLRNIYQSSAQTGETLATVSVPEDAVHYIIQPILADAMIQCFMLGNSPNATALHVPVSIRKFVVFRRLSPQECSSNSSIYVYYNSEGSEPDTVFLFDDDGNTVATMSGIELRATTVNSILSAAGASKSVDDKNRPIDTYEVVWKPTTSFQTNGSLVLSCSKDFTQAPDYVSLLESLEQQNRFTRKEKELQEDVNNLCELFVLKAMYEMGWEPKLNQQIMVEELAAQLEIATSFLPAFSHYLNYLDLLEKKVNNFAFTIKTLPENQQKVEDSIAHLLNTRLSNYGPIHILNSCGTQLSLILQGRVKGQQLLFGSEEANGHTPAELYYQLNLYNRSAGSAMPNTFIEVVKHLWSIAETKAKKTLRILEVGGGTGIFSKEALSLLEEEGVEYSYHFTDVFVPFMKRAEKHLSDYNKRVVYKSLDIDEDPLTQGFPPGYFDIIIAVDVLHLARDLKKSASHIQMLLKEGGRILLQEMSQPIKEFDIIFGTLEEYWGFKDGQLRPTHSTISGDKWVQLLQENGFNGPSSKIPLADNNLCVLVGTKNKGHPDFEHQLNLDEGKANWLLLHDLEQNSQELKGLSKRMKGLGRTLLSHHVNNFLQVENNIQLEGILCVFEGKDDSLASSNCRQLLEPLLHVMKSIIARNRNRELPKFCIATFGTWRVHEESLAVNPTPAPAWGLVRCVRTEILGLTSKLVDLDPRKEEMEGALDALMQEIWMADMETEVIYRDGVRYARRLNQTKSTVTNELIIPVESHDYTVELPQSNLLTDLSYVPKTIIGEVGENEVVVEVKATSLNFKDVLSIMKPSDDFKDMNTIGLDFSGVVTSVGSKVTWLSIGISVFGMSCTQSTISGYVTVSAQQLAVVPSNLTFSEAATLPVAFLTAWYCLVNVAQATSGQTILIHAASGGVGLIAIQIAKFLGLKIMATAGSPKKRHYLSRLGIQYVFNSRTLEYGEKIKNVTEGGGVDIVLNCLTGPGFKEASLDICKVGGYFVEISKLDIWQPEEVRRRKSGVNYQIIDLTTVDLAAIACLWSRLSNLLEKGSIKPLPFRRYAASRIIDALKFLQKAKHIGKVIVEMPTFDPISKLWKYSLFNERSTYLITGGKGAIGLAIAEWMVSQGAKYIVLLGRGPPKPSVLELIQNLEGYGAKIICKEADVANFDECKKVIQGIQKDSMLPSLRGVHHCAGLLSDAMILHQDWENFESALNPKVKGAYNLHTLTLDLHLEHFVVHSSMCCTFGLAGQSNYAAANAYLEALVEKRHSLGLPAMSLSWGQWNVGLAEYIELEQFSPFTQAQGIAALEKFFMENKENVAAGFVNLSKTLNLAPFYEKTFLEDIFVNSSKEKDGIGLKIQQSITEIYSKADGNDEKERVIKDFIKQGLSETLGIPLQDLGEGVEFASMGMDSLLGIEFYNRLQCELGDVDLGYVDMEKDGTVERMMIIIKTALETKLGT